MNRTSLVFIILLMVFYSVASAGWSEDIRLTYVGHEIEPLIYARNDTLHVAWWADGEENYVSYLRSINSGANWDAPIILTSAGHRGSDPRLSIFGDRIFISWFDVNTNPPNWVANIGFTTSYGGAGWNSPIYVFPVWSDDGWSETAACMSGDSVFVAFWAFPDSFMYQTLYYIMSPNLGQTWSQIRIIAQSQQFLNNLRLQKCGNILYTAWSALPFPDGTTYEVCCAVSEDAGHSWSVPLQLSSADPWTAQQTCIACERESGNVIIGWVDSGESHTFPGDLYLRITTDGGYSWGDEIRATQHHKVANPNLDFVGDSIWAVWSDWDSQYGQLNDEICFNRTTDKGYSWTPYERLTYALGLSRSPWVAYDNGRLHLVWYDESRPPDYSSDVYYKRFDPEPDGIEHDNPIPKTLSLSAYPNPFNSTTTITLSGQDQAEIAIYDITGRKICALKTENGRAVWNAAALSSGIYFAVLETGEKNRSVKIVLLK